jgi:putative salt-induced outer membrane protein YdiY
MLLLFPLLVARAEDPTFAGAAAPPAPDAPVTAVSADLGATWSSGNTETYAVNGAGHANHTWSKNRVDFQAIVNVGAAIADTNADGVLDDTERAVGYVENARRYALEARYDRFLDDKNSLYALVGGLIDRFAGYDSRVHGQLGFSHRFIKDDDTELVAEVGADVANEDYVAGVDPDSAIIFAAREMVGIAQKFNENVTLEEKLEAYENLEDPTDTRIINALALTSKLSGRFSIKLTHALAFDNVPVEGFQKLDQTAMATVVVTLL